jgi:ribonucleoside-triphosphate reductase
MNEYLKNKGLNPLSSEAVEVGVSLLKKIEQNIQNWLESEKGEQTIYNLEQIPGESMAVKLCKIDSILGFNPYEFVMYSNQYVPLWEDSSIHDRCKLQGCYDKLTSGGSILHITVNDDKPLSPIQFKAILEQARVTGAKYLGVNYIFSKCEQGHTNIGKKEKCCVCEAKITDHYTRVVGYLSRVGAWNKTRRTWDFNNRYLYRNGRLEEVSKSEEKETVESQK